MRFARRVADYRVHPPRCPHACRTATACVPQPTQCPRQQRASEPHTPQAVAGVGLHMARHMKAASCRLLRSHAAVDGTPRRLTVSHRAPRPAAALPRQQEANFLRNGIFLAAISANRKFLRNQVLDNQRSFKIFLEAPSVVRADEQRGRTTWTSRAEAERGEGDGGGARAAWRDVVTVLGSSDHQRGPRRNAAARRQQADLRPAGAG